MSSSTLKSSIYEQMEKSLQKHEQLGHKKDTVPFLLYTKKGKAFWARGMDDMHDWFFSPFFTVKSLNKDGNCAVLAILEPVGMDGCRVEKVEEVFSLLKTNICLTVDLTCFCAIQSFSSKLVERSFPIIEQKK
ncbi:CotY/CotZ family spore coat protein [Bacillus sp. B190/17]|uniref:CotY/CotZ family spore coat protein n=1 Tax=Bacillus lumedeiriae TaxID=3058829 RepID=A0ABW8I570_9BACI